MNVFLIWVKLYDGESYFVHEAGQPVEFTNFEEAKAARDKVADSSQTFDLFDYVPAGDPPLVIHAAVCHCCEIQEKPEQA